MKLDLASKKSVFKSCSFVMVVCFMLHELRPLMWISGRYIHHRIYLHVGMSTEKGSAEQ